MTEDTADSTNTVDWQAEQNEQIVQRKIKLKGLRDEGVAYRNDFNRQDFAGDLHQQYDELDKDTLNDHPVKVAVAGRIMTRRIMGKASFTTVQDMTGRIQFYVTRDSLGSDLYSAFKTWDLGDIVGAQGVLFKTKTGELSVNVDELVLLTKALRPLPDKYHGLADQE